MERIVVGVDGSQESIRAVAFAGRLAAETGAGLTVVYVRHIPVGYYGPPLEVESAELELSRMMRVVRLLAMSRGGPRRRGGNRKARPVGDFLLCPPRLSGPIVRLESWRIAWDGRSWRAAIRRDPVEWRS